MAQIDRILVSVGFMWLILGMVLGLNMGMTGNNQLLVVHIAMLLPGFVVLAVYGMVYRLWPAVKNAPLAKVQCWTAIVAVLGQVIGAYQVATSGGQATMIIAFSSVLAIIASGLMAWLFWTRTADVKSHTTRPQTAYSP
jgi:ABC-type transport system involved in multi-copper enzyme maturation permease subunit